MTTPLNVALIGYGLAGKVFHAPLISAVPGLALHSVVSSDPAKVHADWPRVRVVDDPAVVFADPAIDLVVIATPNHLHAPQAHAALDHGKHVVIDKPFALSLAEAEAVADHASRAGLILSVFHNRRWDADFRSLSALIAGGELGEVVEFNSHFDRHRPVVRDRWREQAGPGSGLWNDLGPHVVDQALCLFGPPQAVFADLARHRQGAVTDDYFHVVLRYPQRRVILHGTVIAPASDLRFAVHGRLGSFVKDGLDPQEDAMRAGVIPGAPGWGVDPRPGVLTDYDGDQPRHRTVTGLPGDYRCYYQALAAAIRGAGANPVPPAEALMVMRLLDLARHSAAEGREIPW